MTRKISADFLDLVRKMRTAQREYYDKDNAHRKETMLKLAIAAEVAVDIPEVFDLRPLAIEKVTLKITGTRPGAFYFVPPLPPANFPQDQTGVTNE